ncbi:hypothetical protein LRAMOSA01857 [Lichtheimia ramosa]|uniref:Gamma interferon inducible lysosomal thiol reductase GILT n=1 Tax=Lichtheimia ramosa TaxID=688394 RepID=A0A077WL65_9FUNG|nr:hypothetical protein LRAMOSA01857 [Lichtheimia ramosa]
MPANACTLLLIAVAFISVVSFMPWPRSSIQSSRHHVRSNAVPVELFVMSKCPDKVFCENVFSQVLDQVQVPVSLDVNYIAQANQSEEYQFSCKHGPSECLGNIQELCFKHVYPDYHQWFEFDLCLNEKYQSIGNGSALAEDCAGQLGLSFGPVKDCIDSDKGVELLAESVKRTQSLGVTKSCTVYIDNRLRCIHDGTWKDCDGGYEVEDFVKSIEDAYQ